MTAQISDKVIFEDDSYSLLSVKPRLNVSPLDFGIKPGWACTACWRGYWCNYFISEDGIFLKDLYVNSANGEYPLINGVKPRAKDESMGHKAYIGINIPILYTGTVRIGRGFIRKYYVHMGFQSDWKYEEVKDLVFKDGKLVDVIDRSKDMEKARRGEDEKMNAYLEAVRKEAASGPYQDILSRLNHLDDEDTSSPSSDEE